MFKAVSVQRHSNKVRSTTILPPQDELGEQPPLIFVSSPQHISEVRRAAATFSKNYRNTLDRVDLENGVLKIFAKSISSTVLDIGEEMLVESSQTVINHMIPLNPVVAIKGKVIFKGLTKLGKTLLVETINTGIDDLDAKSKAFHLDEEQQTWYAKMDHVIASKDDAGLSANNQQYWMAAAKEAPDDKLRNFCLLTAQIHGNKDLEQNKESIAQHLTIQHERFGSIIQKMEEMNEAQSALLQKHIQHVLVKVDDAKAEVLEEMDEKTQELYQMIIHGDEFTQMQGGIKKLLEYATQNEKDSKLAKSQKDKLKQQQERAQQYQQLRNCAVAVQAIGNFIGNEKLASAGGFAFHAINVVQAASTVFELGATALTSLTGIGAIAALTTTVLSLLQFAQETESPEQILIKQCQQILKNQQAMFEMMVNGFKNMSQLQQYAIYQNNRILDSISAVMNRIDLLQQDIKTLGLSIDFIAAMVEQNNSLLTSLFAEPESVVVQSAILDETSTVFNDMNSAQHSSIRGKLYHQAVELPKKYSNQSATQNVALANPSTLNGIHDKTKNWAGQLSFLRYYYKLLTDGNGEQFSLNDVDLTHPEALANPARWLYGAEIYLLFRDMVVQNHMQFGHGELAQITNIINEGKRIESFIAGMRKNPEFISALISDYKTTVDAVKQRINDSLDEKKSEILACGALTKEDLGRQAHERVTSYPSSKLPQYQWDQDELLELKRKLEYREWFYKNILGRRTPLDKYSTPIEAEVSAKVSEFTQSLPDNIKIALMAKHASLTYHTQIKFLYKWREESSGRQYNKRIYAFNIYVTAELNTHTINGNTAQNIALFKLRYDDEIQAIDQAYATHRYYGNTWKAISTEFGEKDIASYHDIDKEIDTYYQEKHQQLAEAVAKDIQLQNKNDELQTKLQFLVYTLQLIGVPAHEIKALINLKKNSLLGIDNPTSASTSKLLEGLKDSPLADKSWIDRVNTACATQAIETSRTRLNKVLVAYNSDEVAERGEYSLENALIARLHVLQETLAELKAFASEKDVVIKLLNTERTNLATLDNQITQNIFLVNPYWRRMICREAIKQNKYSLLINYLAALAERNVDANTLLIELLEFNPTGLSEVQHLFRAEVLLYVAAFGSTQVQVIKNALSLLAAILDSQNNVVKEVIKTIASADQLLSARPDLFSYATLYGSADDLARMLRELSDPIQFLAQHSDLLYLAASKNMQEKVDLLLRYGACPYRNSSLRADALNEHFKDHEGVSREFLSYCENVTYNKHRAFLNEQRFCTLSKLYYPSTIQYQTDDQSGNRFTEQPVSLRIISLRNALWLRDFDHAQVIISLYQQPDIGNRKDLVDNSIFNVICMVSGSDDGTRFFQQHAPSKLSLQYSQSEHTGWTTMHAVAYSGNTIILDYLLSHDDQNFRNNLTTVDKYQQSPLSIASQLGHQTMVHALLAHGAAEKLSKAELQLLHEHSNTEIQLLLSKHHTLRQQQKLFEMLANADQQMIRDFVQQCYLFNFNFDSYQQTNLWDAAINGTSIACFNAFLSAIASKLSPTDHQELMVTVGQTALNTIPSDRPDNDPHAFALIATMRAADIQAEGRHAEAYRACQNNNVKQQADHTLSTMQATSAAVKSGSERLAHHNELMQASTTQLLANLNNLDALLEAAVDEDDSKEPSPRRRLGNG